MNSFDDMKKKMQENLSKIENIIVEEMEQKATICVGEIQSDTPVKSGNLRRSMEQKELEKNNDKYEIKIGSSLNYAKDVEEGHFQEVGRYVPVIGKKLVKSFVQGRHMIGDNIEIYQEELEKSVQNRVKNEVFK